MAKKLKQKKFDENLSLRINLTILKCKLKTLIGNYLFLPKQSFQILDEQKIKIIVSLCFC